MDSRTPPLSLDRFSHNQESIQKSLQKIRSLGHPMRTNQRSLEKVMSSLRSNSSRMEELRSSLRSSYSQAEKSLLPYRSLAYQVSHQMAILFSQQEKSLSLYRSLAYQANHQIAILFSQQEKSLSLYRSLAYQANHQIAILFSQQEKSLSLYRSLAYQANHQIAILFSQQEKSLSLYRSLAYQANHQIAILSQAEKSLSPYRSLAYLADNQIRILSSQAEKSLSPLRAAFSQIEKIQQAIRVTFPREIEFLREPLLKRNIEEINSDRFPPPNHILFYTEDCNKFLFVFLEKINIDEESKDIIKKDIAQISIQLKGDPLYLIVVCFKILETVLASLACKYPTAFSLPESNDTNKQNIPSASRLIKTAYEIGLLRLDGRDCCYFINKNRNYIHSDKEIRTNFHPGMDTARVVWECLRAAINQIVENQEKLNQPPKYIN